MLESLLDDETHRLDLGASLLAKVHHTLGSVTVGEEVIDEDNMIVWSQVAVAHANRKPGARKSSRDQLTDTPHGKAVDRRLATQCPSAAVNGLLADAGTVCTEPARCAGPALPASTALYSARGLHGIRGS